MEANQLRVPQGPLHGRRHRRPGDLRAGVLHKTGICSADVAGAYNSVQPHLLIAKLAEAGAPPLVPRYIAHRTLTASPGALRHIRRGAYRLKVRRHRPSLGLGIFATAVQF